MSKIAILLLVASFAAAAAIAPVDEKGSLRFAKARADPVVPPAAAGTAAPAVPAVPATTATATQPVVTPVNQTGPIKKGATKNPSTTMKCLLALSALYFMVVVLIKVLGFKVMFDKLFNKLCEDIPGGGRLAAAKNAAEAQASSLVGGDGSSSEPLVAAENKARDPSAPSAPANPVDWVKNLFSTETLSNILGNMIMVPMFCILITFVRLRSRVDLESEPSKKTQTWMMVSTGCLMLQILVCLLPMIPETPGATGCSFGKIWAYLVMLLNIGGMIGLYVGIVMIINGALSLTFQEHQAV